MRISLSFFDFVFLWPRVSNCVGDGVRYFEIMGPPHFACFTFECVWFNCYSVFWFNKVLTCLVENFFGLQFDWFTVEYTFVRVWLFGQRVIRFIKTWPGVFFFYLLIIFIISLVPKSAGVLGFGKVYNFSLRFYRVLVVILGPTSDCVALGAWLLIFIFH